MTTTFLGRKIAYTVILLSENLDNLTTPLIRRNFFGPLVVVLRGAIVLMQWCVPRAPIPINPTISLARPTTTIAWTYQIILIFLQIYPFNTVTRNDKETLRTVFSTVFDAHSQQPISCFLKLCSLRRRCNSWQLISSAKHVKIMLPSSVSGLEVE